MWIKSQRIKAASIIIGWLSSLAFGASAQNPVQADSAQTPYDSAIAEALSGSFICFSAPRTTEHQWLFSIGGENLLDTYLSPLAYKGTTMGTSFRTERFTHFGAQRWTVRARYSLHAAYLASPTDNGKEWDMQLSGSGALLYDFFRYTGWRFAAGGALEGQTGFTYNTRNGNNPAQGRAAVAFAATGLAEYTLRVGNKPIRIRTEADFPLVGLMFSPNYGQSYYEIFSLGHYDKNVRVTFPGNAPEVRWTTTLSLPFRKAHLSIGYEAEIRQYRVNDLKYHAWNHRFLIGYTRHINLVR
ncbi:DUF3316 domain-containing protein [Alloprevotella tannerae]|uniref:DUF3316 domain-containing protein n=1 Tax=Alloprevotella tannerae TaxID=76122 RepID=UPI0028EBC989|nr:DUF3316 domain-containing protein [Alloprevotella tannerae]